MAGSPRRKSIPKPSQALKSFNWAKIPAVQIEKTIWSKMDDSTVHQVMDLRNFEETFSAYQRKEADPAPLMRTLRRRSILDRPKELSVIEGKKAQNCSIVLSTLKMTNAEIHRVVMTMDKDDRLEKDMVEQLLKYVPTMAERELLNSHAHEMESFARPDRFLLEMSRIPRYYQRLKSLFFKKTLSDRLEDVRPKIEAVHYSCKELKTSTKLKKVLEVVLAFGNFMNRGNRGNASGFRLNSLNKMGDTKSSTNRDINLLHYLIQTLESKFPDALGLETDLPHIRKASKVDFKEVEKEFRDMQDDLRDLEHELEFQRRSGTTDSNDLFVPVMEEFAAEVRSVFSDILTQMTETKTEFLSTLLFFGEDPNESTTEEFFGIFTVFLHSFTEAHVELIALRKRKEEEEKRREEMEKQKQLTLQKRKKRQEAAETQTDPVAHDSADYTDKAELDDLIAVLKSGEYFDRRRGQRRQSGVSLASCGNTPRNSRVFEFSRDRSESQVSITDPSVKESS
jgi:dishevelled associated activator of morphogenesis